MHRNVLVLSLLFALSGCADVSVRKVPTPAQYDNWDDPKQAQADAIEGVRYYLPRPYVAVKKEFPFSSKTFLIHGTLSADGHTVVLDGVNKPMRKDLGLMDSKAQLPVYQLLRRRSPIPRGPIAGEPDEIEVESEEAESQVGGPGGGSVGGVTTSGAAIQPLTYTLVDKVATFDAKSTNALAGPNSPVSLNFTVVAGNGLAVPNRKTIRAISLLPIKNGLPVAASKVTLPRYLLTDTGQFQFKGVLPGLTAMTSYVLGVEFLHQSGKNCLRMAVVKTPLGNAADLQVGSSTAVVNVGSVDHSSVNRHIHGGGIVVTGIGKTQSVSRPVLDFSVVIKDIEKTVVGADVKKISSIGLAPVDSGNGVPNFDGEVKLPFDLGTLEGKKWSYAIRAEHKLPVGKYVVAIHVEVKSGLTTETSILYGTSKVVIIEDIPVRAYDDELCTPTKVTEEGGSTTPDPVKPSAGKDGAEAKPKPRPAGKQESTTTTSQTTPGGAGAMILNVKGNKDTSPLIALNDYFDIIHLPDFDEQFAVDVNAGMSLGSVALGLENGWMMENYGVSIDNRAIANFLFFQIDKTLDVARDLVKLDKGLLAPVTAPEPEEVDTAGPEGFDALISPRRVLLRVHKIEYAVPGLYPVLKPREIIGKEGYGKSGKNSAVIFDTRSETLVELVHIAAP